MDITNISAMTEYTSSLAAAQNTDKLKSSAKAAQTDEEMMDACKEFETYLWEQVIKSMKKSAEVFQNAFSAQSRSGFPRKQLQLGHTACGIETPNSSSNPLRIAAGCN